MTSFKIFQRQFFVSNTLILVFLLLNYPVHVTSTTCTTSTYSYGGSGSCASCSIGSTFISSTAGCSPSTSPVDTSFYLSGTMTEGVSAFSTINSPLGISYTSNVFGIANSAITLSSGSYLSAIGTTLPDTLPIGNTAWSISAWIKCTPTNTWSTFLEWGDMAAGWTPSSKSISLNGGETGQTESLSIVGVSAPPFSVAIDASGNAYVTEPSNNKVKKITLSDSIIIIGTSSSFSRPHGIAVDSSSNVYVADTGNNKIKKISSSDDTVSIIADGFTFSSPHGIAVDASGTVYVSTGGNNKIFKIVSGTVTEIGTGFSFYNPHNIAVDTSGNVYVADTYNFAIKKISPADIVISIGTSASFSHPQGIPVDTSGNVYVADSSNNRLLKINPYDSVSEIGTSHSFNNPTGIAISESGTIYVTDTALRRFFSRFCVCDSTWRHVALLYSPGIPHLSFFLDGKIYVNHRATITLPPRSSSTLRIGWNGISNTPGSFSDLRIYSRTLSPSEVESLSQPTAASFSGLHLSLLSSSPNGGTFLFTCIAGYAGPIAILSKSQPDNSYSWSITPSCVQCPAGTFSQQGAISCTFCSPGTYSLSGSSYCSLCPAGTYGNRAGLTSNICSGQCSTPADCPTGTAYPPSSSSTLSCATNTARALPNDLNMRLWPAAHPANIDRVDKIVAPEETCKTMLSLQTCVGRTSVVIDGVTRYVIGTAAELNMEASEELLCES